MQGTWEKWGIWGICLLWEMWETCEVWEMACGELGGICRWVHTHGQGWAKSTPLLHFVTTHSDLMFFYVKTDFRYNFT